MADTIASEGGHWYTRDGKPCYEVPKKNGDGMRATTVRDARTMQLVPSVTGISGQLDKPGLVKWSAGLMLKAVGDALYDSVFDVESMKEEVKKDGFLWDRWEKLRIEARERGTAIHTAIERTLVGLPHDENPEIVRGAIQALAAFYAKK